MERKQYIENNDDKESLRLYLDKLGALSAGVETVPSAYSLGRVTAEMVFAQKCDPSYNASAMDGIAVAAEDTGCASESNPLELVAGEDFEYINTGGALKGRHNAVIMIEDVISAGKNRVKILSPAYPWQHVRVIGESIVAEELILPSGHLIRPADIGAMIASGNPEVKVYMKPKVGIIPTGAEMIDDPDKLCEGKLMESNSKVFAALTEQYGGHPVCYPVVEDDKDALKAAVTKALRENDMVLVNAGSSAGTKDYTVKVIEELGEVLVHGVAMKPGKPTILGIVDSKPVIGIPGYPVSAYIVYEMFAKPVLLNMAKRTDSSKMTVRATLTRRLVSSFKNAEIIRVMLGEVGGRLVATPLDRAASAVMSLVKADGLLRIERLQEGLEAGAEVSVELLKPLEEIRKSLVIIGSHDMIIDVISDALPVASAHVGSMGGISALLRGECHLAPIHLLDGATGVYNESYIAEYFPGKKMALIKGVGRIQGIYTAPGNPQNIKDVEDIVQRRLCFANRQRGAGTRILFDYYLKFLGVEGEEVLGYEKEYGTHLSVAAAVKNGAADCGLGVLSAAKALGVDFIPVGKEEYDFLLPYEYLEDSRIQRFIEVIRSTPFRKKLEALGGYTSEHTGEVKVFGL